MRSFGNLEARVMHCLWSAENPQTVHEVVAQLEPPVAYTTAITVIERLRTKGWVDRRKVGRSFQYTPTRTESEYAAKLMSDALSEVDDRLGALLSFAGHLDSAEAARLREALTRSESQ